MPDDTISQLLKNNAVDLNREFRTQTFKVVHLLLQKPLHEMFSTAVPDLRQYCSNGGRGVLYLYNALLPHYLDDNMEWDLEKRMNLKLILQIAPRNGSQIFSYKLKNSKIDRGTAIVRRQAWKSTKTGWQRHEYKLFETEVYYKPEKDGTLAVCQRRNLRPFPTLVHYFQKPLKDKPKKRKFEDDSEILTLSEYKESRINDAISTDCTASQQLQSSSEATRQFEGLHVVSESKAKIYNNESRHEKDKIRPEESISIRECNHSNGIAFDSVALEPTSDHFNFFKDIDTSSNDLNSICSVLLTEESPPTNSPIFSWFETCTHDDAQKATSDSKYFANATLQIRSYAPDQGPSSETTKILVVVESRQSPFSEVNEGKFYCVVEDFAIEAKVLLPGVLEINLPPRQPGVVFFVIEQRKANKSISSSNPVPFCYTPSEYRRKLSLAYYFTETPSLTKTIVPKFRHTVKELDLSGNALDHLDFLEGFYQLDTLILDHNCLKESTAFPILESLLTLSVNSNLISRVDQFLDQICLKYPNLQYLSTLNNSCCPFFSERPHHYYNYRIYVISRLRHLKHLDSSPVRESEHKHAAWIREKDQNFQNNANDTNNANHGEENLTTSLFHNPLFVE